MLFSFSQFIFAVLLSYLIAIPAQASHTTAHSQFIRESQDVLKAANLNKIEKFHCQAYEKNRSNAEAAFGCFMAKTARMFESAPITDFLDAFKEPAIHVQANILDPKNPEALCTKMARQANQYHGEFPNLPFSISYDFNTPPRTRQQAFGDFFKEMMMRAKIRNIPIARLQSDLFALDGQLTSLLNLLGAPKKVSGFSFTIPKELCQVSRDIVVRQVDVQGFYGILGSVKFFANLLRSYNIGLDPSRFTTASGEIIKPEFVSDANGVGGDGKKFAELISGRGDLSSMKPWLMGSLKGLIALIGSVRQADDSEVFGELLTSGSYTDFFDKVYKTSQDLVDSLNHPGILTPMTQLGHPDIQMDATEFLRNLPDPRAINNADPFVIHVSGAIRAVGDFFRDLLQGRVEF